MRNHISILVLLLLSAFTLRGQDFLEVSSWCGKDSEMPLSDFFKGYDSWDGHPNQGTLAWRHDTLFFAEYRDYEFAEMHQMVVPKEWVRELDLLADAATKTVTYFHAEISGLSLANLYYDSQAARVQSPTYGRALELSELFDRIIKAVMEGDTSGLRNEIAAVSSLSRRFRMDYPSVCFRPSVGISIESPRVTHGGIEAQSKAAKVWFEPITEQHDKFQSWHTFGYEGHGVFLTGSHLIVSQPCLQAVDSVALSRFAFSRQEEYSQLARYLVVNDYRRVVEIILSDTVSHRQCYVGINWCYMLLPTSDRLSDVVPPMEEGYYRGSSPQSWQPFDEKYLTRWWKHSIGF